MNRMRAANERMRVLAIRATIVVVILAAWQAVAASGLLFRDVVPNVQ